MKFRSEVGARKLRGGYYTPRPLVEFCWARVAELQPRARPSVLEPSAGDGRFFSSPNVLPRLGAVTAVEIDPAEAAKCQNVLARHTENHQVIRASFLRWVLDNDELFDVAVGNPPFLRFQFVSDDDRAAAALLGLKLGLQFEGVSNLWMPIVLGALAKLAVGGAAAFIIPAELFSVMSATAVRRWITENFDRARIDFFPPGEFPGVLQEVVIFSGRRVQQGTGSLDVEIVQHSHNEPAQRWTSSAKGSDHSWMHLLLAPSQRRALAAAKELPSFRYLRDVARLQVSIVTGANDYFCVDQATLEEFKLERWAIPMLPRQRHATGLRWTKRDQAKLPKDSNLWMLHFSEDRPSPLQSASVRRYLDHAVELGIPERYKCRVRSPWYRVPDVWAGDLLLSKRSHRFPRVLRNDARIFTTDTIYRGRMLPAYRGRDSDLVAGFHNSVTLLTSELEGRSYGGGVHELVPSEIGRLAVPMVQDFGKHLQDLDAYARSISRDDDEKLIDVTDALLLKSDVGLTNEVLAEIREAREALLQRRLDRSSAPLALDDELVVAS